MNIAGQFNPLKLGCLLAKGYRLRTMSQ
jgi:hypothetical protein